MAKRVSPPEVPGETKGSEADPLRTESHTPAMTPDSRRSGGHGWWEWIEASGIELVGIGRLRFLLRRFGWKGLLVLAIVVGYPVGQYSLISYVVNSSLPVLAGDFGVRFQAAEWSYHPLALRAVARNVRVVPAHDTGGEPLFTAAEVEFQGSLASSLRGVTELLTFQTFHTFNEITIRYGHLFLERSRTGTLNWSAYEEAMPEERRRELQAGLYRIRAVVMENGSVTYVEHLAGDSGGGVIQTTQARVHVDGINGAITDIGPAGEAERLPTQVRIAARSADGTIDIEGRLAFGPHAASGAGNGALQAAGTEARGEGLRYQLAVALSNIGAAAFTRTLPATRVVATGGSVHGHITLRDSAPECETALAMENVTFAPNAQLVVSRVEYETLQRQLGNRVVSRPFVGCEPATPGTMPPGRIRSPASSPVAAIAASFSEQANADAPREVRLAVARDSESLTGRTSALVLQQMAGRLPPGVAAVVEGAAAQPAGNAVTRGLRRLFRSGGSGADSSGSRPPPRPPQR